MIDYERLNALEGNVEFAQRFDNAESPEDFYKLFSDFDMQVTEEDLAELFSFVSVSGSEDGEISECDLEGVSGGSICMLPWLKSLIRNKTKQKPGKGSKGWLLSLIM